jgi:hypothetical protein
LIRFLRRKALGTIYMGEGVFGSSISKHPPTFVINS